MASDEVARIRGGEIAIRPYRYGHGTYASDSCQYCVYKGLCRRESGSALIFREPGSATNRAGQTETDVETEAGVGRETCVSTKADVDKNTGDMAGNPGEEATDR